MKKKFIVFIILLILTTGLIYSKWEVIKDKLMPEPPETPSIRLEYKYRVGEELSYRVSTTREITSGSQTYTTGVNIFQTFEINSIDPGGVINYIVSIDRGEFQPMFGSLRPCRLLGPIASVKMLPNGKLIDIEYIRSPRSGGSILKLKKAFLPRYEFPKHALKIGDSWTQKVNVTVPHDLFIPLQALPKNYRGKKGAVKMIGEFKGTLKGFKEIKGYQCAEIAVQVTCDVLYIADSPVLDKTTRIEGSSALIGILYFAYREGRLIKEQQRIETNVSCIYQSASGQLLSRPLRKITLTTREIQI